MNRMNRMHPGTFILSLILSITLSVLGEREREREKKESECTFQRLVRPDSFLFSLLVDAFAEAKIHRRMGYNPSHHESIQSSRIHKQQQENWLHWVE